VWIACAARARDPTLDLTKPSATVETTMHTRNTRRSAALFAVAGLAVVLPLGACGSESGPRVETPPAQSVGATAAAADVGAIWEILLALPARDADVLVAGFTPEVRADLGGIVEAIAGSVQG
jgi:hypothetical protein